MCASVIGAQLYTVRDFLRTPAEIRDSFRRVADIGYEAVQCSGLGPIDTQSQGQRVAREVFPRASRLRLPAPVRMN